MKVLMLSQSLDNMSNDCIFLNSNEIPESDTSQRQIIVEEINKIAAQTSTVHSDESIEAKFWKGDKNCCALVEIRNGLTDARGRIAPLIIAVRSQKKIDESWAGYVRGCIVKFALTQGREITEELRSRLTTALHGLIEKSKERTFFSLFARHFNGGIQKMDTPLPKDSQRRKIVLVLPSRDIEKCEIEGQSVIFKNNDVSILEVPVSDKNAEIVCDLAKKGLLTQYRVLVQEPFSEDAYEDLSEAPVKFTIKKAMLFSTLCAHLGAKKVQVLEVKAKRILSKSDLSIKKEESEGRLIPFLSQMAASLISESKGEASNLAEKEENLRSSIKLEDTFEGSDVDLKRAKSLVDKYNLGNDFNIVSLLETMSGKNRMIKRKFTIDISSEMKAVFSILGRLSLPGFIDLAGSYKNSDDINVCYSITFEVDF